MLYPNVKQLQEQYLSIMYEPAFQEEFHQLLQITWADQLLYIYAARLSEKYQTNIYLKREDLCHTELIKLTTQ
jgi:tryptophan synthase beta chain